MMNLSYKALHYTRVHWTFSPIDDKFVVVAAAVVVVVVAVVTYGLAGLLCEI